MSKGSGRRPCFANDEEVAERWAAMQQANAAAREFAKVLTDRAAIFTALTFDSIEEAESAAKTENEDLSEGFGPWN